MVNKKCLARGIERNEEPEGIAKLTESRIALFGYWNFKIVEKIYKKLKMLYTVMLILNGGLGFDLMPDESFLPRSWT